MGLAHGAGTSGQHGTTPCGVGSAVEWVRGLKPPAIYGRTTPWFWCEGNWQEAGGSMKRPLWQIRTLDNVADIQTELSVPAVFLRESIRSRASIAEQQQFANNSGNAQPNSPSSAPTAPPWTHPPPRPRQRPGPTLLRAHGTALDQPSSAPTAPPWTHQPPRPRHRPRSTLFRAYGTALDQPSSAPKTPPSTDKAWSDASPAEGERYGLIPCKIHAGVEQTKPSMNFIQTIRPIQQPRRGYP
jgi:hypothetical protein